MNAPSRTSISSMSALRLGAEILAGLAGAMTIAGCSNSSGGTDTVAVQGDVPIAYVQRSSAVEIDSTNGTPFAAGGDLMIREKSSASAPEYNITHVITQNNGDVSDPEVSYDAKKIVFSLRCPTSNTSTIDGQPACTGKWNIWEYDMSTGGLTGGTLRRITSSTEDDDVDPVYLPAGRGFVFSSNRQAKSKDMQALGRSYYALDEYERERVLNLHTMDNDGANVQQITFNQSHDRNAVIRPNGDIMFSRWDHIGDRNHFPVFRVKPDGTDMFVLYGAHSAGNSFLHPRDMSPTGKYNGFIASDLMPLLRTQEGGAIMLVDAANYSEQNTPANTSSPTEGGQRQLTMNELNPERGLSMYGRATTPYPLWDGTDRILVSYAPCQVRRAGVVVSCTTLTSEEIARLSDSERLAEEIATDTLQDNVRPEYAVYMFDPAAQTWLIVAAPPSGRMNTDPIAIQVRPEPNATELTNVDATLAQQGLALVEVRSVYDTDRLERMGSSVLTEADLPTGCTTSVVKKAPTDPLDTRALVADLVRIKDPADQAYLCAPTRFVRALRAVAPPISSTGLRRAIGETNFEQQQILGYAPVEPDGSFKLLVPADTPLAIQLIDSEGRAFQTHTNWIQARPGERRTCDGCHSPRRGGAINSGSVVDTMPSGLVAALANAHLAGETMASTRTRVDPTALNISSDMVYEDVWADTTKPGVQARPSISLRYTGNTPSTEDLATAVPTNGIINYPQHIQPLWTRDRGTATCTNCHNDAVKLDLRASTAGTGRLTSYEELMVGDPVIDPTTGLPQTRVQNGVPVVVRGAALVENGASEGDAVGLARKSRLIEILFGQTLMAGEEARTAHPNPPNSTINHATILNRAEKRLVSEWIDLGGQYYNDPFDSSNGVRTIETLDETVFEQQVFPILRTSCAASCHQAVGSEDDVPPATSFTGNRYVLTGDVEGDLNATIAMINDTCQPALNPLLLRPATIPHPAGATGQTAAVLQTGSANYTTIANWIRSGCTAP